MVQVISFIDVYHGLNRFLGTVAGELAKNAFELVLFTLVTYMVASEWTRSRDEKKDRLQWFIWGFAFLSATKLLSTIALSYLVFGGLTSARLFAKVSILDNIFEILAVLMISIGFLQPVLSKRQPGLLPRRRYVIMGFLILGAGIFFALSSRITNEPQISGLDQPAFFEFNLAKLLISIFVTCYIILHRSLFFEVSRYYPNVIHAMAFYGATPVLHLINYSMYANHSGKLIVLSQPFPFVAVLFITRVIFLQLADKAALYDELARTEAKYKREKELSDLKDEFVSVVSHELKTPLTAISLWSSLIRTGKLGKISRKQKDACTIIKKESFRLSSLINDVLDLSKLEKGKMVLKPSRILVRDLCNVESLHSLTKERRISIVHAIPFGLTVTVDPDRFKQAIYNLVSNAIKFTPPGGTIRIEGKQGNPGTTIIVSDTGIGIAQDKIGKLFSKFYQIENYLTRRTSGTGLGLSITKQIVELHGGTISVESFVGKGTTFTILLPAKKKPAFDKTTSQTI